MPERVLLMSLFDHATKIVKKEQFNEKTWEKFEMKEFESQNISEKERDFDFIGLQTSNTKKTGFIPFGEKADNPEKKREAKKVLQKSDKKNNLLEQEAYEKGFSQGEKDGFRSGEKKVLKKVEIINKVLNELSRLKKQIPRQYEKQVLDLIFVVAKKIIRKEIALDNSTIGKIVLDAFMLASEKNKVILRLNPEDVDYIEKFQTQLFGEHRDLKSVSITSDPSITRGGCFLETSYGDIDATVETQLEKVYRDLANAFDETGS